jgi:hypothetical protein
MGGAGPLPRAAYDSHRNPGCPRLSGSTDGLEPVVFLTGGARPGGGSFPSLALHLDLAPDGERQFTWAHAALSSTEQSFELARQAAARKWDAERSPEMLNASQGLYRRPRLGSHLHAHPEAGAESFLNSSQHCLPHPSYSTPARSGLFLARRWQRRTTYGTGSLPGAYYLACQVPALRPRAGTGWQNYLVVQQ